jgi:signal transduction histidine kinase
MTAWPWPRPWLQANDVRLPGGSLRASKRWSHWTPWAYVLVCAPLVLLLVELLHAAVIDVRTTQRQFLGQELLQLQSQAQQRAAGLVVLIEAHAAESQPWNVLQAEPWLSDYWSDTKVAGSHKLYAAIVDASGTIVMHTDPATSGRRLEREWYQRQLPEVGPNVVSIQKSGLSSDRPSYDVTVPLNAGGQWVGDYHEGLDAQWLNDQVASRERTALTRWCWILALASVVDGAAVAGVVLLARRQSGLWQTLRAESRQRAREMAQLGSGLAHEIRNPLHALRINLHTLRRAFGGRSSLPEDQLVATIEESDAAIDRLDGLMRDLLQFADPSAGEVAEVDVVQEVQAALSLLTEQLKRDQIQVRTHFPQETSHVTIDPMRLRQSLLNLLTFAQHRAGKNGAIDIVVKRVNHEVEITVGDSGPSLPEDQRDRVFEPFQAPAETGSGLGLALVQVYVEEAGGRARWDDDAAARSRCRLWFPLAQSRPKGDRP